MAKEKAPRLGAMRLLTAQERRQAARYALSQAKNVRDARTLLDVLGLVPTDALPRRTGGRT